METYRKGYGKTHKGNCKGVVRFVENLSDAHWEWDFECIDCGKLLTEEEVEIIKIWGAEREGTRNGNISHTKSIFRYNLNLVVSILSLFL